MKEIKIKIASKLQSANLTPRTKCADTKIMMKSDFAHACEVRIGPSQKAAVRKPQCDAKFLNIFKVRECAPVH